MKLLLTVVLLLVLAPTTADAKLHGKVTGRQTVSLPRMLPAIATSARVQDVQQIAAGAWGDPCGGAVRIEWINFRRDPRVQGAHPLTWGAAVQDGCVNGNSQGVVMLNARRTYSRARLCTVVLHEYGHLAGWRDPDTGDVHASDPFALMWADQFPDLHDDGAQEHLKRDGEWVVRRAYDPRCR
jgi:hypothetical protein